jgi:hypothetical protein
MAPDDDVNTPPAPHPPAVDNGAVVVGRECGTRPREAWTPYRENTYQFHGIRMRTGHMCLDLPWGELRSGATIQVWKCSDYYNPNQVRWGQGELTQDLGVGKVVQSQARRCVRVPSP